MSVSARLYPLSNSAFWRRTTALAPYVGAALFAVMTGHLVLHHEMWRDEIQAWLLARAADTPWGLFQVIKYEGHPGLWHLLLWPLTRLTDDPAAMQWLNAALTVLGVFILYRAAPFAWPLRILVSGGYYLAYEYAVIARNYAICLPVIFAICALWRERWRHFIWIGVLFFLLCHTNVGGDIITLAAIPFVGVDFAVAFAGRFRQAERYGRRFAIGMALMLAGPVTGAWQMNPPADTGYAPGWYLTWNPQHARARAENLINAMLPLPTDARHFWNSNRMIEHGSAPVLPVDRLRFSRERVPAVAGLLVLGGLLLFLRHPWPGAQWLFTLLGLYLFAYIKYPGSWRHHGLMHLAFLMCFWMSYHYDPWRLPWRIPEAVAGFLDRHRAWLLLPLLLLQCQGAWLAARQDLERPFSPARDAAAWLKREYPAWKDCVIVAHDSTICSTLCGYLDGKPFWYWQRGEYGTYVRWDRQQTKNCGRDLRQCAAELSAREKRPCLLVMQHPLQDKRCRLLRHFPVGIVEDERYFLYEWKNP